MNKKNLLFVGLASLVSAANLGASDSMSAKIAAATALETPYSMALAEEVDLTQAPYFQQCLRVCGRMDFYTRDAAAGCRQTCLQEVMRHVLAQKRK